MALKITELARETIYAHLNEEEFFPDKDTIEKYKDKKASFVTIYKNNKLRGCIGSLEARQELWKDVQENAINAGFHDPRFPPLTDDEFNDIKIEVSVLSTPKKLSAKNSKLLLDKIHRKMGLILKKATHQATFLPQVWEEIPNKKDFLEHLSLKAGLDKDEWESSEIWYYTVESEKE